MAWITLVESKNPERLGKRFTLRDDGTLEKHAVANVTLGDATALEGATPEKFASLLKVASGQLNTFFFSGRLVRASNKEPYIHVTEKKLKQLLKLPKDQLGGVHELDGKLYGARLKRGIEPGPWVLIDADNPVGIPADWAAMSIKERLELLEPVLPGASSCLRIEYRASSARVVKDGDEPGAATHAWIQISDPDKLDVLRHHLGVQTQLQGLSFESPRYARDTGDVIGAPHRTVIDLGVFVVGQPAFCAEPTVEAEGFHVVDANVQIVNPDGGVLDISDIALPSGDDLVALQAQTGTSLSFTRSGNSVSALDCSSLHMDTPIQIGRDVVPFHKIIANMGPGDKVRCETPFRYSVSEAAFIRIDDDGNPFLHDVGSSTTYRLDLGKQMQWQMEQARRSGAPAPLDIATNGSLLGPQEVSAGTSFGNSNGVEKVLFTELLDDHQALMRVGKGRAPVQNVANAISVLIRSKEWDGVFAFNELTDETILTAPVPGVSTPRSSFRPRSVKDTDVTRALVWFQRHGFPTMSEKAVSAAIHAAAVENIVSPVRHMLEDIEERVNWTPETHQENIHNLFLHYFGAGVGGKLNADDIRYLKEIGRRFMVAAVARALSPGCKVDTMVVLEGKQGDGKSEAIQDLFGEAWFSDSLPDFRSKESMDHIRGKWVIEVAELDALNKSEVEAAKAFITRKTERYRRPYDRSHTEYKRRCVFIGTTNKSAYLRDETGNRRFWPVAVGEAKRKDLKRDREELWAEAVFRYRQGEEWHLTGDLVTLAEAQQSLRRVEDIWLAPLARAFENETEVALQQAADAVDLVISRVSAPERNRLIAVLSDLGFKADGVFTSGPHRNARRYRRSASA